MPIGADKNKAVWVGACDMCRLRKVKCDKRRLGRLRCTKSSYPCTYGFYRPRRTKVTGFSIKAPLPWLTSLSEQDPSSSQLGVQNTSVNMIAHMLEALFIDPFSKQIIHEALDYMKPNGSITGLGSIFSDKKNEENGQLAKSARPSSLVSGFYLAQKASLTILDQDQVNSKLPLLLSQLLVIFFQHVNIYHPLVNQQWAYDLFNSDCDSAGKKALLYMIGLIALDFYPLYSAITGLRVMFFSRAHKWLNQSVYEPSFASCLALTLATSYRFPVQSDDLLSYPNYRSHELAVRMAYLLGLHKRHTSGLSETTMELRKRLFLALYVFDCMSSYSNNRPRLIPVEKAIGIEPKFIPSLDGETPYGGSLDLEIAHPLTVLLFNSYTNKFTAIMDQVYFMQKDFKEWVSMQQTGTPTVNIYRLSPIFTAHSNYQKFLRDTLDLERQLHEWYMDWSIILNMTCVQGAVGIPSSYSHYHALVLFIYYLSAIIMINRPLQHTLETTEHAASAANQLLGPLPQLGSAPSLMVMDIFIMPPETKSNFVSNMVATIMLEIKPQFVIRAIPYAWGVVMSTALAYHRVASVLPRPHHLYIPIRLRLLDIAGIAKEGALLWRQAKSIYLNIESLINKLPPL